ncbi:MAG: aldehyde dehydrogenase family protein [Deltaproteobacteria bacterium]|nr:aldehyde dehydrogenase family protein [Deltaproteobacteria bacterium]
MEKTARLKQGVGTDVDVEIGPLTTAAQLEIVEKQVEEARRRGAKVLIGGERNSAFPGYFYKPTVLTNVDHSMEIMAEETFGPLLPIMMFADDQEAIRLANDTKFGLTASIWTRDMKAARAMARELRAGTVTINECLYTHAICQTPWGGRGWSGFGRTHGRLGLLELVEPHHIHVNAMARFKSFWWYPYDQQLYTLFRNFTRRITGGWLGKLWHLPKILKATKTVKL